MSDSFLDLFEGLRDEKSGGSSVVYKADYKKTNSTIALKMITLDPNYPEDLEALQNEVGFHKNIDYPLILHYFGSSISEKRSCVILEYGGDQSLLQYLNNRGPLTEALAQKFFIQVISSLNYLHSQVHILHSDVKLENILIDYQNNAILIDFGLCCSLGTINPGFAGTLQYTAPEIFDKTVDYTGASDIWSAGVILYAMLLGCLPFGGESEDSQEIIKEIQNKPLEFDPESNISQKAKDLLNKVLTKDPQQRAKVDDIKADPWIADSPYATLLEIDREAQNKLKVLPSNIDEVDKSILKDLAAYGYQRDAVIRNVLNRNETEDVLYYRIKRLQKNMKDIYSFRAAQYKVPREIPLLKLIPSEIPCYTIRKKRSKKA